MLTLLALLLATGSIFNGVNALRLNTTNYTTTFENNLDPDPAVYQFGHYPPKSDFVPTVDQRFSVPGAGAALYWNVTGRQLSCGTIYYVNCQGAVAPDTYYNYVDFNITDPPNSAYITSWYRNSSTLSFDLRTFKFMCYSIQYVPSTFGIPLNMTTIYGPPGWYPKAVNCTLRMKAILLTGRTVEFTAAYDIPDPVAQFHVIGYLSSMQSATPPPGSLKNAIAIFFNATYAPPPVPHFAPVVAMDTFRYFATSVEED